MSPVFGHGALRLYLLSLLDDQPRHGYELMRLLEDRFMGMYTPSAGTVYPRLNALEADGLVEYEVIDGRKTYRLTDAGREELEARRDEIEAVVAEAVQSARVLAKEIRDDVRASVRDLRRELKEAVRDVRREERRVRSTTKDLGSALRADLDSFVADVIAAGRRTALDAQSLSLVRDALLDAREAVIEALGNGKTNGKRR